MTLWAFSIVWVVALAAGWLSLRESGKILHHRVDLFLETLPPRFDGYTVRVLSDLHFGRRNGKKERILAALNAAPADLCVITGDLIENDDSIVPCIEAVRNLRARDGTFCVLGNHDYFRYSTWDSVRGKEITDKPNNAALLARGLEKNGVRLLRNENAEIRRNGESLWLAGVDDPVTGREDLSRAFSGIPPDAFRILLSHSPDILKQPSFSREGLVLSGHTHGGQIVLPFWGPILNHSTLRRGFVSGMMKLGTVHLLVSNGVGVNRLFPFRFRCRPEIHTLRLRRF